MSIIQGVLVTRERNQQLLTNSLKLKDEAQNMLVVYNQLVLGGAEGGEMSQAVYRYIQQIVNNMEHVAANVARLNAQLEELQRAAGQ